MNTTEIYKTVKELWQNTIASPAMDIRSVRKLLISRTECGLKMDDVARLLWAVENDHCDKSISREIIETSGRLRSELFHNKIFIMAPIEIGNVCASNCKFCGWRSSNKEMLRKSISNEAILAQAAYLMDLGIRHIEIVGGDDIQFVKNKLPGLIISLKELADAKRVKLDVSICTMALTGEHYELLRNSGLDCMLSWQETYDEGLYKECIDCGPKAFGIDANYKIANDNGYKFRLESQKRACRAGLQVGLGHMLGLSQEFEMEILSTISHAHSLIDGGVTDKPVIIGMPTLNSVISKLNHAPLSRISNFRVSCEREFVTIAAIYLLALPNKSVWIFPNCRVPLSVQADAVRAAGYFTSTQVRLGPGGYLIDMLENVEYSDRAKELLFAEYGETMIKDPSILHNAEQFAHHFHKHSEYVSRFRRMGLEVVL